MSDIHSRIKALRKRQYPSLESFADTIGVSWQTVQQWEKSNGTAPKRTRLEKVAKALGTTANYLMTGLSEPTTAGNRTNVVAFEPPPNAYIHNDKTIAEIVTILEATDEKGRIMALGAIRVALAGHVSAKANPAS
jgi:transcriptional regulator with XRE-family HTH domain